jgi:hypothetical protein
MTIIIAALCENRRAAVVAADRLLTYEGFQTEGDGSPEASKLVQISPRVVVGCSYDDNIGRDLIRNTKESLRGDTRIAPLIAEAIWNRLDSAVFDFRDATIKRMLGGGYSAMREMIAASNRPSDLIATVAVNVEKITTKTVAVVVGYDGSEMRLFMINVNGIAPHDNRGLLGIGSGGEYATISLVYKNAQPSSSLAQTIVAVHEAKRAAEINYGVGPGTDLVVLRQEHPAVWFKEGDIKLLDEIVEKRRPRPVDEEETRAIQKMLA